LSATSGAGGNASGRWIQLTWGRRAAWLDEISSQWDEALDRLKRFVEE
jgi:hypothetical protein